MLTNSLKKLAEQLEWKRETNFIWGMHRGYLFSARQGQGFKQIETMWESANSQQMENLRLRIKARHSEHRIKGILVEGNTLILRYPESFRSLKADKMQHLLDFVSEALSEEGAPLHETCSECGDAKNCSVALLDSRPVILCENCYLHLEQSYYEAEQELEQADKKYGAGSVGAVLGALVGAIPWIIVSNLGFLVAILGYFIGQASLKGYKLCGGIVGQATKWIILISTILSLCIAQLITVLIIMVQNDVTLTYEMFITILAFPGVLAGIGIDMALSLVMAGLGIWPLFVKIKNSENAIPSLQRAQ